MEFSKNIISELKKAGWNPQRKIEITKIIEYLNEEGYKLNEYAKDVIAQFGFLEMEHPSYRVENSTEKLHFNPIRACDHIYRERVEEYEYKIGESLVVIGEAYDEHLILMISDRGHVYGGYDGYLTILGDSIDSALEAIFLSKETVEIV